MFTKLCSLVGACAAVLTLAVVSSPAASPVSMTTAGSAVAAATTAQVPQATSLRVLPFDGHYLGMDAHHRTVRMVLHGGRITHFFVNHTRFPDASLQGHQWHHTCGDSLCTRGSWTTDTTVEGRWNDSRQGGDVHFTVHLMSH